MEKMPKTEEMIVEALRSQVPVKGLPGVSIQDVREQPEQPFDISFELLSGANRILVLGEIKAAFSPCEINILKSEYECKGNISFMDNIRNLENTGGS